MEGLWIFLWLMSLSLVSQLPESGCQMLSSSFTWSADLDLPCDRYFDSCWQSINIKSVSDCENICTDFGSSCLSFTYGWTSGVCTISNISSYLLPVGYMDLVTSKNVSLFQRSRGEVSDLFEKWPHSTLPLPNSYTTILEGISLATCAEECTRNTHFQCQSFDFRSATQSCYLSDTRADQEGGRLEYFDDIDHYEYKQNVWPCNISIPYNYTGSRVVALPRYPSNFLSESACVTTIWIKPGCKALLNITWVHFDRNICNKTGEGILMYADDNSSELQLNRICQQDVPEVYEIANRKYLRIITNAKTSPIQYQATFVFVQEETYTMTSMLVSNQSSNGSYASCKDNPCENGGICQEIKNSNLCICSTPYRGATCGELMESCIDNRCVNGQCINGNDTYMCKCEDGYTGRHCDTDIDECLLNVCHGSDCRNTPGGYQCICPQCQFGLCVYTGNTQGCQCFPGFIGLDCSEEVDECEDVTSCLHGTCVDYVNGVECNCNQGYTGRRCDVEIIHPCDGDPCECGACVIVGDTDFQCQCPLTRRGKRCENFEEFFTSIIDPDDLTTKFCNVSTCDIRLRTKCEFSFLNYFQSLKMLYSNIAIKSMKIGKQTLVKMSLACNTIDKRTGIQSWCKWTIALIESHSVSDIVLLDLTCDGTDCSNTSITINSLVHLSGKSSGTLLSCFPMIVSTIDRKLEDSYISRSNEHNILKHPIDIFYKLSRAEDELMQNSAMNVIIQMKFLTCLDYPRLCESSKVDTMVCAHGNKTSERPKPFKDFTFAHFPTSTKATRDTCRSEDCVHGYCQEKEVSSYCLCDVGFTGQYCDVAVCDVLNCRTCDVNAVVASSLCLCDSDILEHNCNKTAKPCDGIPCLHGNCRLNINLEPYCQCHPNFTGKYCESNISLCDKLTCVHGNCSIDIYGFPQCHCDAGFLGSRCEYIRNCDVLTCVHGNCTTDTPEVSLCECWEGYTGSICNQTITKCDGINCIHGDCLQNGSCRCFSGYEGINCDHDITDPRDDGDNGVLFEYFLWVMVAVLVLLVVTSIIMAVCVRVKRSRGEFSFHHLRRNEDKEAGPRLVNSRDIYRDLRRGFYLSPTTESISECHLSASPTSLSTFHQEVGETENGTDSVRSGSSEAYRRYSVPDDGHLSMHDHCGSTSGNPYYDIPSWSQRHTNNWSTDTHTVLRNALPLMDNTGHPCTLPLMDDSTGPMRSMPLVDNTVLRFSLPLVDDNGSSSSSQTHYGEESLMIVGALVGKSDV